MKLKLGKLLDYALPILAGIFVKKIEKRAEKRGEKEAKKGLDTAN